MTYDLIIIGSGPGGYSAAVRAGQYGLKTAIIEKDPKLGGTCLHVGCIPTKALLHTADVWDHFIHPGDEGITCDNPKLDLPAVMARKTKIVDKHAKGVEGLMKKNKVEWVKGYGTIKGPGKVEVKAADGSVKTLEAKTIITRVGHGTKIIFTGDPYQIDNPYVDSSSNGFNYVISRFRDQPIAAHIELQKGERSELAELAANIL